MRPGHHWWDQGTGRLRFPYVRVWHGPGYPTYARLTKRRRLCRLCGHHHGPNKNRDAKVCQHRTGDGSPCGCRAMVDWKIDRE